MKTIEQKTAETILQETATITIGKRKYKVPAPTTATLIQTSALISQLPNRIPEGNVLQFVLGTAEKCEPIGAIMATLILGQHMDTNTIICRYKNKRKERLAKKVLCEMTPRQINEALTEILRRLEVADFFAVTTSLIEINTLKATRGVETKTIASGQ